MTKFEKIKSDEASGGFVALLFAVMFVALAIVFYFVPFASDDWEFFSYNCKTLSQAAKYSLHYGNGRFLGNLGGIFLAQHPILATLYKSFSISLLGALLPIAFSAKKKVTYLMSYFLLLTIPAKMFAQVFSWNCGNVNYITPIVLLITGILIIKSNINNKFDLIIKCIVIFILGISQQLYIEHNSVVNVCIAIFIFLYCVYKKINQKGLLSMFWLFSNFIGLFLLFFIPKLIGNNMIKNMDEYHKVNLHSLSEIKRSVIENGITVSSHLASLLIITVIMYLLCYLVLKKANTKTKFKALLLKVLKSFNVVCSSFSVFYTLIGSSVELFSKSRKILWLICIGAALEVLIFLLSITLFSDDWSSKFIGFCCLMITGLSLVPLLVVNPIGWRNTFFAVSTIIFLVLFEFEKAVEDKSLELKRFLRSSLAICISVVLIYVGIVMIDVHDCSEEMINYVESEMKKGETKIQIFRVPSDYKISFEMLEYVYYYKEKGDIEFELIDYNAWKYNREKEKETEIQQ